MKRYIKSDYNPNWSKSIPQDVADALFHFNYWILRELRQKGITDLDDAFDYLESRTVANPKSAEFDNDRSYDKIQLLKEYANKNFNTVDDLCKAARKALNDLNKERDRLFTERTGKVWKDIPKTGEPFNSRML